MDKGNSFMFSKEAILMDIPEYRKTNTDEKVDTLENQCLRLIQMTEGEVIRDLTDGVTIGMLFRLVAVLEELKDLRKNQPEQTVLFVKAALDK